MFSPSLPCKLRNGLFFVHHFRKCDEPSILLGVRNQPSPIQVLGHWAKLHLTKPELQGFRASERAIAGMDDGLAESGSNNADAVMLRGLTVAKEQGMPAVDGGGK